MHVIDSHTEGEPTRIVVSGGPDLGCGPLKERLTRFREQADHFRRFAVNEPRGWDAVVGGLLCEPTDESCAAGVIFFNNTGYLGMCGHGTIGLAVTLHHLGRIGPGTHKIETPVGIVRVKLIDAHTASVENVPSYRFRKDVSLHVEGIGDLHGDIAWGGNWFFLIDDFCVQLEHKNLSQLTDASQRIIAALKSQSITGKDGAEIDHVEFSGPTEQSDVDSVNFVMCPGGAYDRSPCGTGTSAELACLAADGKLAENASWVQQSVCGGTFSRQLPQWPTGRWQPAILPTIVGSAFICSDATLVGQQGDPFCHSVICGAR